MKKQQIPNFNDIPAILMFNKDLSDYLPQENGEHYVPIISKEDQNKVLKRFKDNTEKAKFSFTISGLTGEVTNAYGIKKCLGYEDETFSIPLFLTTTHPQHTIAYWMNGASIWSLLDEDKKLVTFDDSLFFFSIALKHADRSYKYCHCESIIFQISECGKAIEFGYEFTIYKDWNPKDEFTCSLNSRTGIVRDANLLLTEIKKKKFASSQLFTLQELNILSYYANNTDNSNITASQIAAALKIAKTTVDKHNVNILNKTETFFHKRFESASSFANHLRWLSLL